MKTGKNHYGLGLGLGRALLGALALVAVIAFAGPRNSHAATAAGTAIVNSVEVSWDDATVVGGRGTDNDSVTITVSFVAQAPTLTLTTATPVSAGQETDVDLTYRITTNANDSDIYSFPATTSVDNNATAPTLPAIADITLGATSTIEDDGTFTTTVFKVADDGADDDAVNDLAVNDYVVIGGERVQISAIVDDGTTATITLASALSSVPGAGVLVAETQDFTTTVTAGTISGASPSHTVTVTATDGANPTPNNSAVINLTSPGLTVTKLADVGAGFVASPANVTPGTDITYQITVENTGAGVADNVTLIDDLSPFASFEVGSITFTDGATSSSLTYTAGADDDYSNDNQSTWAATPTSGTGGAPAGYDATITDLRVDFSGQTMAAGSSFVIEYTVQVK